MVSIIVPVYNVARYLRQGLESIQNQTLKDWECILVDDGSTDGSGAICDEFAAADSRFKVIHQPNSGVAVARNVALDHARGEYIGFADPDDWVDPDMYEQMLRLAQEHDADMVQVGYYEHFKHGRHAKPCAAKLEILSRDEAARQVAEGHPAVWMKLFRREVITTRFPLLRSASDLAVIFSWMKNINRMVNSPLMPYHYRRCRGSITKSNFGQNRLLVIDAIRIHLEQMAQDFPEAFTPEFRRRLLLTMMLRSAKAIARRETDPAERLRCVREIADSLNAIGEQASSPAISSRLALLMQNPEKFIRKMRFQHALDLHARWLDANLFD